MAAVNVPILGLSSLSASSSLSLVEIPFHIKRLLSFTSRLESISDRGEVQTCLRLLIVHL